MIKKEILNILRNNETAELLNTANEIRKKYCGEDIYIRGIIEFSNNCKNDCLYCGLRKSNNILERYRMNEEEILDTCSQIIKSGIKTIVLQSGDDYSYSQEFICGLIEKIKAISKETAITLSIGERSIEDYKAFKACGADRYLIKQETISSDLYKKLHPGQTLEKRLDLIKALKDTGFQIGVGNIIGLPGQSLEDIADDILFFENIQPDMIGISPFIAQSQTPLAKMPAPELNLVLKVIALTRIVTKNSHMPVSTAFTSLYGLESIPKALYAGCNVFMINATPPQYLKNYRIYDNKIKLSLENIVQSLGLDNRKLCAERGDSLKK